MKTAACNTSTFSPALNVFSWIAPVLKFLNLERTNADPFPGFTCWKSITFQSLDVHEGPNLSRKSENELVPNNCVTIEPGIYIDGLGGVRIEDDILITENGCEYFTKSTKNLIIL